MAKRNNTVLAEMLQPFEVASVKAFSASLALIADVAAEHGRRVDQPSVEQLRLTATVLDEFATTLEKYQ